MPGESAAPRVRKSERLRLARAELLVQLAMSAGRWANELRGGPGARPFEEWPHDDALKSLCRTYRIDRTDLAKAADDLADRLERQAIRAGYDERWDGDR